MYTQRHQVSSRRKTMPILQINFKLTAPVAEYEKICDAVAHPIADVPGLRWKVWLLNERDKEAGGIYLFDTKQALNDYLAGPIVAQVKIHRALQDLSAKTFDVMEEVTAITRGPVSTMAAAQ
jgi:Putative mono-oxygenase ydhR